MEAVPTFHLRHPNRPSMTDLKNPKPRRSSAHRSGGTVMNDSPDSPERTDSPEPRLFRREPRSMSGVDADPGGFRWAQRETSPTSLKPPSSMSPGDMGLSSVDEICTQP